MAYLTIQDLSFTYPNRNEKALDGVSLSVKKGDFCLLCGKSGCGKTTLLQQLCPPVSPFGKRSGEILLNGSPLPKNGKGIGFVRQDPQLSVVTDKVWRELAFGAEGLGMEQNALRLRVAETANFFGIQGWFRRDTASLSGGQLQLLSLASVMVMHPQIILLDEPTAQLDPIAAREFFSFLKHINTELGTTVILSEQRTEELFSFADSVFLLEKGKILFSGAPRDFCKSELAAAECFFPSAARLARAVSPSAPALNPPLTVREGQEFLRRHLKNEIPQPEKEEVFLQNEVLLEAKNLFFAYKKDAPEVLRSFSCSLRRGEALFLLGGNGSGKTTVLKLLAGVLRAQRGEILIGNQKKQKFSAEDAAKKIAWLPQNARNLFLCDTVRAEFLRACADENKRNAVIAEMSIEPLLDLHPFDLSGGELQKCAITKLLLREPDIFLFDEPTKGLDPAAKAELLLILDKQKEKGKAILCVSHDVEFAAECADRCSLLFDGENLAEAPTHDFFSENRFYTTAAARISRPFCRSAVTQSQLASLCKKEPV